MPSTSQQEATASSNESKLQARNKHAPCVLKQHCCVYPQSDDLAISVKLTNLHDCQSPKGHAIRPSCQRLKAQVLTPNPKLSRGCDPRFGAALLPPKGKTQANVQSVIVCTFLGCVAQVLGIHPCHTSPQKTSSQQTDKTQPANNQKSASKKSKATSKQTTNLRTTPHHPRLGRAQQPRHPRVWAFQRSHRRRCGLLRQQRRGLAQG